MIARGLQQICNRFAKDMQKICKILIRDLQKIKRFAKDLQDLQNIYKICKRFEKKISWNKVEISWNKLK